ncbi:hypothetical protein DO65_1117 [Burkholderia pseudomallei]|nr:hypothetical protein DO65_1117 [Burkholderia pseudomallei]
MPGHEICKVDKRPFREVPAVSRIPPATGAEAIEKHHRAIGSQSVGEALHQDSLTHPARSMDNERKTSFASEGSNVAKNVALNDDLNLGKRVRRGIQPILVLHFQLSQNRHPINSFVRLATGTGLDPDEIPQFEQAFLRIRIPWFAPCSESC